MRVEVLTGEHTGFGTYTEDVTVYFIVMPDGSLRSRKNAEEKPTDEEIAASGGTLEVTEDNPKIIMDDGHVVYGCQVWWDNINEE